MSRRTGPVRIIWLMAGLSLMPGIQSRTAAQSKTKAPNSWEHIVLKPERDYLAPVGSAGSPLMAGAKVEILLQNGKRLDDQEVTDVQAGKNKNTFRTFGIKSSRGKRQKVRAGTVSRILIDAKPFDVLLDSESKDYVLLDNARRDQVVGKRLNAAGRQLWGGASDEQQAQVIDEYKKDYVSKVRLMFADREFQLHETKFFLFCTDMPVDQVEIYIANLDRMYLELCKLFGIFKETNIWRGKCLVVAFQEKSGFLQFESEIMEQRAVDWAQGLCHSFGDGKVVISCYRGNNPAFFGNLLVHETTHGFMHLYRSNVDIPSWLNEGLAEWVANLVVPESNTVPNRQRQAIPRVQNTGTMGGMLDRPGNIDVWQYGLASGIAQFLIDTNPQAYGGLFTLIKEGTTWREALDELYGMSPEELAAGYGRTVGVPDLKP
jgi:hypothetical protein